VDKGNVEIKYFKPLDGFGNFSIPFTLTSDVAGKFMLLIEVTKPTTAKFFFGSKVVWLLLQPNDSIHLDIKRVDQTDSSPGWIVVTNQDKAGYEYYNQVYNLAPITKFYGIRDVFENSYSQTNGQLIESIKAELGKQTQWLDSLKSKKLISQTYHDYLTYEIQALLAAEACQESKKRYKGDSENALEQRQTVLKALFKLVDPTDAKLRTTTFAHSYYSHYLTYKAQQGSLKIDSSNLIIDELPYIEAAWDEPLKAFLWGRSLVTYFTMSAEPYDYCALEKKYSSRFGTNEYTAYLDAKKVCTPEPKKAYAFLPSNQTDFLVFLSTLPRNNYYIDLWASWCVPCVQEFKSYDLSLLVFFEKHHIKPLFISIDEAADKLKWEKAVDRFNLQGYHLLASPALQGSIKDVLYNNGDVSIPRYVLINTQGAILLDNAKRPSDGTLQNQLLEALNEKAGSPR